MKELKYYFIQFIIITSIIVIIINILNLNLILATIILAISCFILFVLLFLKLSTQQDNKIELYQLEIKKLKFYKECIDEHIAISKTSTNGIIKYANKTFYNMYGYEKNEIIEKKHNILNSGKHDKIFWKKMWQTISKNIVWEHEVCNKSKDGNLLWAEQIIKPIVNSNGKICEYLCLSTNKTETKQAQQLSIRNYKLASLGVLAAGIGHELNNPLSIIQNSIHLIQKKLSINNDLKKVQKYFNMIDVATSRMIDVIDGIRTFARADTNHLNHLDSHKYISITVNTIKEIYKKEGINIILELNANKHCFIGNIGKFQQVLINLLANSKDAFSKQENKKIIIETLNQSDRLIIKVTDNADGIPPEKLNQIFDAFFTTKPIGKGTGIGLSITYQAIQEMNGEISVNSSLGVGTTFILQFNDLSEQDTEQQQNLSKEDEKIKQLSGDILIVDDDIEQLNMLQESIECFGLDVDIAHNGQEALNKLIEHKYDVLLTDLQMPIMDGFDLILNLYKITYNVKIIIFTGGIATSYPEAKRKIISENACGYILKPFNEHKIYTEISSALSSLK